MPTLPSDWTTVGFVPFWRRLRLRFTFPSRMPLLGTLLAVNLLFQLAHIFFRESLGTGGILLLLGVILAALFGALVVATLRWRAPDVDSDASHLRVGRDVFAVEEISRAVFLNARGHWYLKLTAPRHRAAVFCVRSPRHPELDERERELVAEVLRRSSVAVPERRPDPYDPKGRFARLDHPTHLSRDEAVDWVRHTPPSGVPERTPAPRKSIWRDEA
jgi:hypothetical protein